MGSRMRLIAISLLAFACASSAKKADNVAAPASAAAGGEGRRLMVIGINDTHGALLSVPPPKWISSSTRSDIGGAEWFAGYLNAIRADYQAKGGEVVVLDAGDEFQGTLISNEFRGRSVTDVYNAVGVTASAIGNHEFDFGIPVLKERIAQAKYPILAANIFLKGTKTRPDWIRPSAIVDQGGIRIGIIGLATKETPLTTNPVNIEDLDFADGGPVAAAEADALRAAGATVVLITAHAGPYPPGNEIQLDDRTVSRRAQEDACRDNRRNAPGGVARVVVADDRVPVIEAVLETLRRVVCTRALVNERPRQAF